MNCPKCKKPLNVERILRKGPVVKRKYCCKKCKKSHWTVEIFEDVFAKEKESHQSRIIELPAPDRSELIECDRRDRILIDGKVIELRS